MLSERHPNLAFDKENPSHEAWFAFLSDLEKLADKFKGPVMLKKDLREVEEDDMANPVHADDDASSTATGFTDQVLNALEQQSRGDMIDVLTSQPAGGGHEDAAEHESDSVVEGQEGSAETVASSKTEQLASSGRQLRKRRRT